MMHAFTQGLMDGDFFHSLIRKPPRDYDHMLKKAIEYINVEEAQAARKKETPAESAAPAERRPQTIHQPPRGPRVEGMRPHQESRSHAVQHVEVERPMPRGKVWTPMFCPLHQSATHSTRDCRSLAPITKPRNYRRRSPSPNRHHNHQNVGRRIADSHPSTDVHTNQEATPEPPKSEPDRLLGRKKIEATPLEGKSTSSLEGQPAETPTEPARWSSVNIIFKRTFDQLQIDRAKLLPMTTPLFGFTGNEVQSVGQMKLAISLGEELLRRMWTTNFTVVDALSAYNVILDRLALSEFRAVVSTFYQKIKFPVEDQVGEVKDIEETFGTLRTYGVKLNSQKCLFRAKSGCFLGYIVTERGIEVNPSKVKALQDMSPPRNLKEAQRLTGRITALSRFISKTVDRSLPFFKILR
ncbi:uncharacterized protein LOC122050788 [Zingiber officinale]|uniref:uncharacterized protein LOC122050788 n=1 Tax=Zingiber officinale TaxID=94328 RepID=UPI001C4AD17A|nr:uncharacterized protein LOC122050788 [Zingiber officinale]